MDAVVIEQYIGDLMSNRRRNFLFGISKKPVPEKNLAGIISTAV